jgi:hypothetical protein
VRLLAYVTDLINQELLLKNEYLAAENRILRAHLPARYPCRDRDEAAGFRFPGGTELGYTQTLRRYRYCWRPQRAAASRQPGGITPPKMKRLLGLWLSLHGIRRRAQHEAVVIASMYCRFGSRQRGLRSAISPRFSLGKPAATRLAS